jgi:LDH2 family malate/lactate/ureidoglycolate dehydrogenase
MPTVDAPRLERLTQDIFVARGVPSEDAAFIAAMLVRANLRGHDSHGVIRVPQYVANLKAGTLNPRLRNWSLWLDLHILVSTVRVVLLREGAF